MLVSVKDNEAAYGPQILPGGKAILYTLRGTTDTDWDKAKIVVQSLEPGSARQTLIDGGREARFVSTGHIVYAYQGTVFAIPFDVNQPKVTSGPTPVVEGVRNSGLTTGASQFSVADNGTLVFVPGPLSGGSSGAQRTLAFRDRSGNELERLKVPPRAYSFPRVSLFADQATNPAFSPDGRWLAYQSIGTGAGQIFVQPFPATEAKYPIVPGGHPFWSYDGSELFYNPAAQQIGVVRINTKAAFSFGEPITFSTAGLQSKNPQGNPRVWDIAPDHTRLIGVTDATESVASGETVTQQIEVVLNWFTDLRAKVPIK